MDILSLSKASKVYKDIEKLDKEIVAPEAESHFMTVDHRLDWIEDQTSKIDTTKQVLIDLSKGTFHNTELVNGKVQLKGLGVPAPSYTENLAPLKDSSNIKEYPWKITGYPGESNIEGLFDRSLLTSSASTALNGIPGYFLIDTGIGHEVQITKFSLTAANLGWPRNWRIEASHSNEFNGEEIILYENENETYIEPNQTVSFTFINKHAYRYYRIYASTTYGNRESADGNRLEFREIQAFGPSVEQSYVSFGTYETPIIDLGEGWTQTNILDTIRGSIGSGGLSSLSVVPVMTSHTTPEPFVIDSSSESGTYPAWRPFHYSGQYRSTTIPAWISVDLVTPIVIGKYSFITNQDTLGRVISWEFQGSHNNQDWITLHEEYDNHSAIKEFQIDNTQSFRYYRIYMHELAGTSNARIYEIHLFGGMQADVNTAIEISTSSDGVTFSNYEPLDESNPPQTRYMKIRATLTATPLAIEPNTYTFNQEGDLTTVHAGEHIKIEDEKLSIKTAYQEEGIVQPYDPSINGSVMEFEIDRTKFKKIQSLEVE